MLMTLSCLLAECSFFPDVFRVNLNGKSLQDYISKFSLIRISKVLLTLILLQITLFLMRHWDIKLLTSGFSTGRSLMNSIDVTFDKYNGKCLLAWWFVHIQKQALGLRFSTLTFQLFTFPVFKSAAAGANQHHVQTLRTQSSLLASYKADPAVCTSSRPL